MSNEEPWSVKNDDNEILKYIACSHFMYRVFFNILIFLLYNIDIL